MKHRIEEKVRNSQLTSPSGQFANCWYAINFPFILPIQNPARQTITKHGITLFYLPTSYNMCTRRRTSFLPYFLQVNNNSVQFSSLYSCLFTQAMPGWFGHGHGLY